MTDTDADDLRKNIRMAQREMLVGIPAIPLIVLCLYALKGPTLAAAFWLVMTGSFMAVDVVNGRWWRQGGVSSFVSNSALAGLITLGCWIGYTLAA